MTQLKNVSVGELFVVADSDRKKVYRLLQSGDVQQVLSHDLNQWSLNFDVGDKMDRETSVIIVYLKVDFGGNVLGLEVPKGWDHV